MHTRHHLRSSAQLPERCLQEFRFTDKRQAILPCCTSNLLGRTNLLQRQGVFDGKLCNVRLDQKRICKLHLLSSEEGNHTFG